MAGVTHPMYGSKPLMTLHHGTSLINYSMSAMLWAPRDQALDQQVKAFFD